MKARNRRLAQIALISFFLWLLALVWSLRSVPSSLFLAVLFTAMTLAIYIMVWDGVAERVRPMTQRVPNPMRSANQLMADAADRTLSSARTTFRNGRPSLSRLLEVDISVADYATLLASSTLEDLESYLTRSYRDQLKAAGKLDPAQLPLVTLVCSERMGRGRFDIRDIDLPDHDFAAATAANSIDFTTVDHSRTAQPVQKSWEGEYVKPTQIYTSADHAEVEGSTNYHARTYDVPTGGLRSSAASEGPTAVMSRTATTKSTITATCGTSSANSSGPPIIVGSKSGCQILVPAPGVREEHLSILQIHGQWVIRAFDGAQFYIAGNPRTAVTPVDGLALHLTSDEDSPVLYLAVDTPRVSY